MKQPGPHTQIQHVRMRGHDLARSARCPHCLEAFVPADGSFIAIRFATKETLRFHVECYPEFLRGLAAFRHHILRAVAPEPVH